MSDSDLSALKVKLRDGKAIGLNQSKKLIKAGLAETVFVANDADGRIRDEIKALCHAHDIVPNESETMANLGKICGIDVDCAVYAVSKIR